MNFSKITEKDVTKAIVEGFSNEFLEYIESDVIIVGAGPSGLVAGKKLAEKG
ncbi:MAG: ribose 1,5-bisphosphate isomerase, partial [Methanobacterium sp.]